MERYTSHYATCYLMLELLTIKDEIIMVINAQEGVFTGFNDNLFNVLMDRIEILEPTHFVFILKNGKRKNPFSTTSFVL